MRGARIKARIALTVFLPVVMWIAACGHNEGPWAISIALSPETAQVTAGGTRTFTATVVGHKDSGVAWSVAEGTAGGTITDRGVYTAPLTPGTFHVVATSLVFPGKSVSAAVTVTFPPGALDPGFGAGGKVAVPIGPAGSNSQAAALIIPSDGKILMAGSTSTATPSSGDFAFVRLNSDGTIDTAFDTDGRLVIDFNGLDDSAWALAVQPDGKMVVAGAASNGLNTDFAIVRLTADGALDGTFDTDGKVTTDINSDDSAFAVALQADRKIVAAGSSSNGADLDFAVTRYNADGTLDSTFDADGKAATPVGSGNDAAKAMAIQTDGKIVVAGFSFSGPNSRFALARYNSDGTLDSTFGTGGVVTSAVGIGDARAASLVIQPDGKLIAAGVAFNGLNTDFAVARYNTDGTLDSTFGTGGSVTTDFNSVNDAGASVSIQSDGKVLVAGASVGANEDFAVARYNADGTLDSTFGTAGKVTTPIGSGDDAATAVSIQSDGKIVIGGRAFANSGTVFSFARYWP